VRDLERLKEVRNYRVTGPQLVSLFGLAALVVAAAFVAGFEVGLWQRPVDNDLLSPGGANGEREASEVLAALLAEREQEATPEPALVPERLAAPSLSDSLDKIDAVAEALASEEEPETGRNESGEAAAGEEFPAEDALTTRDDTVRPLGEEPLVEPTPVEPPAVEPPAVAEPPVEEPPAEQPPAEQPPAEQPPAEQPPVEEPPVEEPPAEEPPVEEPPVEVSEPQTVTAELALPTASGRRGYTVQLAAFENPREASDLIKSLQGEGYDAFHQRAEIGDKTWYRVRVGLHSTKAKAEREAARIAKSSSFDTYVTSHP